MPQWDKDLRVESAFTWSVQAESRVSYAPAYSIALWGDSLTASRDFIDAALSVYKIRKESVQPAFIQAGLNVAGISLPLKAGCATEGWKVAYAYKDSGAAPGFSKGLLSITSDTPGDAMVLDFRSPLPSTRLRQLTIVYQKSAPQGLPVLGVAIDGADERLISLSQQSAAYLQIRPTAPMASVKIRLVAGQITVHGFEPLYQEAPAVILDSLSVPGAWFKGWSNVDARYVANGLPQAPDYDLILIQYGTNEGVNADVDRQKYGQYLRTNLACLRKVYPRSRCVLIGPPDRGVVGHAQAADLLKYAKAHRQIALAQKQAALEFQCGFWDWQAAMGGAGAAAQ